MSLEYSDNIPGIFPQHYRRIFSGYHSGILLWGEHFNVTGIFQLYIRMEYLMDELNELNESQMEYS